MRTSGKDIYVTAGDNFYFTIVIKDEAGDKIPMIEGTDFAEMNIKINNSITKIKGRLSNGEFSFYVPSDLGRINNSENYNTGVFHYEVKKITVFAGENEPDLVTTIIPKSLFVIEETIGGLDLEAFVYDNQGRNPDNGIDRTAGDEGDIV